MDNGSTEGSRAVSSLSWLEARKGAPMAGGNAIGGPAPAGNGGRSPAVPTELEALRAEVGELSRKLPTLPNWFATLCAICGLLAALVAVVGGIWGAYAYLSRAPKLSLIGGPTLALAFLPRLSSVTFEWAFSIGNDGDLPNVVTDLSARVDSRTDPPRQVVVFTSADFDCSTGQAKVSVPFPVGEGLPTPVTCSATASIPESGRAVLADGNPKQFVLSIVGQRGTNSRFSYCFDLPDEEISQLRSGGQEVSVRFVHSSCD